MRLVIPITITLLLRWMISSLERRLELSWEMHNRQDDIRFGVYDKGMWAASNCVRKTDAYLKLFPISQDAYQSNDKLTQNPGYPAFK